VAQARPRRAPRLSLTVPKIIWSYFVGYVSSRYWLILQMNGMRLRVAASHRAKDSEGRRHRVAVSLDCELDDFFRRRSRWDLGANEDPAVCSIPWSTGRDRQVAGARQAAMLEQGLQTAKYPRRPVAVLPYPVDEIRTGQMELRAGTVSHLCPRRSRRRLPGSLPALPTTLL